MCTINAFCISLIFVAYSTARLREQEAKFPHNILCCQPLSRTISWKGLATMQHKPSQGSPQSIE